MQPGRLRSTPSLWPTAGQTAPRSSATACASAMLLPQAPLRRDPAQRAGALAEAGRVAVPLVEVEVPGALAPILLPADGLEAAEAFRTYAQRLAKTGAFPAQRASLERLEQAAPSPRAASHGDRRPVVGVIVAEPEDLLQPRYEALPAILERVERLGCRPVLIPPRADLMLPKAPGARQAGLAALVQHLDGLVGPGGRDVHPRIYRERNRHAEAPNYPADRFEADLALTALSADVYMLGICRSHQLWNAAAGGKLVQDVLAEGYSEVSQRQRDYDIPLSAPFVLKKPSGEVVFENRVQVEPKSQLAGAVGGARSLLTNSSHHQAVKTPGRGFRTVGVVEDSATGKDTIEATEAANALTVQWHPELMTADRAQDALFETLARRAEIFRIVKALRREGRPSVDAITRAMRRDATRAFPAADYAWVRSELARRFLGPL